MASEAAAAAPASAGSSSPKLVDTWLADLAALEDLEPENATPEELEKVAALRAGVLKAQGLEKAPEGVWEAHFYLRAHLLRFLRGRNGNVEKATEMLANALKWFEEVKYWGDWMRKYEDEDDPQVKELMIKYAPEGPFGVDKRGAPVIYCRLGLKDLAGMVRETSWEAVLRHHVYHIERDRQLHLQACRRVGKWLMGGIVVLDLDGMTWGRSKATVGFLVWLSREVLTDRFPESIGTIYLINVPWFFQMGWTLLSPALPEATKAKMQVCRSGFLERLQERIDIDQIPAFLGGKSPEPWPYGEGGEVPNTKGEGSGDGASDDAAPLSLEVSKQEVVEAEVPAGKTIIWEWCVKDMDIDCTVSAGGKELVAKSRVEAASGWQAGRFTAPEGAAARLTLSFDNTYSWLRKKQILYKTFVVDTVPDAEPEGQPL